MNEKDTNRIITSVPTQAELMSSSLDSNFVELPTFKVAMPRSGLGVKGELLPFCQRVLHDSKGEVITTNVFASITTPGADENVMLFGDEKRKWLGIVDEDGLVARGQRLPEQEGQVSVPFPGVDEKYAVAVSKTNEAQDGFSWAFRLVRSKRGGRRPNLHVSMAEGTTCVENPVSTFIQKEKTERRKKIVKRLAGAVAVVATLTPGGLIDKVIDPFVGAAAVVTDAGSSLHWRVYTPDDHFDGMDLKDYPDVLAQLNKDAEAMNSHVDAATNVAKQTMVDLDSHNYDAIKRRAQEYVERNTDNFLQTDVVDTMREQIMAAGSEDEVLAALQPLMKFYNKDVSVNHDHGAIDVSRIKSIATAIVNEIGTYPKSLVRQAKLDTIVIGNLNADEKGLGTKAGDYNRYDRRIRINAFSDAAMVMATVDSSLPIWGELNGGKTYEATIAHEFGHALRGGEYDAVELGDPASNWVRDIVGALINYPEVMSEYSRSNTEEKAAEDISGVLSDRSDGLTHPDDSRRFVSPANKALLARLISFGVAREGEPAVDPGIIDYLVAGNSRLMGRSFVSFGH